MLSIGIRFGLGFDWASSLKIMQSAPEEFTYDLAVLGSDPGGMALAREASAAGKKVVIIKWKNYSPAEMEGRDEDLDEMGAALELLPEQPPPVLQRIAMENSSDPILIQLANQVNEEIQKKHSIKPQKNTSKTIQSIRSKNITTKKAKRDRKVRASRLDLNNEFFKRGQEARKMMRNAVLYSEKVLNANHCGWRVPQFHSPLTLNWNKMSENVMDYIMKENWKLATMLNVEKVEVIEGRPAFINEYTIKLLDGDVDESLITAEMFCIAPSCENIFPERVKGALDYGITPDDFIRLDLPPKKTLVVGGTPEGLECAGIVASSGFHVTVMTKSAILDGFDAEMTKIVVSDLKKRGVVFLEKTTLVKIEMSHETDALVAKFDSNESVMKLYHNEQERNEEYSVFSDSKKKKRLKEETFDTVVFAVGRKVMKEFLFLEEAGISVDSNGDIHTDEYDRSSVPHIYALGRIASFKPKGHEISEVAGRLLGKRLYHGESELMDYSLYPTILYTPIEYAFIGISEDAAIYRLGVNCVDVYTGLFKPLEFVLPAVSSECFMKLVVHKPKGSVIGIHIIGPEAGEIIQGFSLCLKHGLTVNELYTAVGVHATKAQQIFKLRTPKKIDKSALNSDL